MARKIYFQVYSNSRYLTNNQEFHMKRVCFVCSKGSMRGHKVIRRGMAKKKGGAGQKITGISKRVFLPNLQLVNILVNKRRKKAYVCVKCLKAGKVAKA